MFMVSKRVFALSIYTLTSLLARKILHFFAFFRKLGHVLYLSGKNKRSGQGFCSCQRADFLKRGTS